MRVAWMVALLFLLLPVAAGPVRAESPARPEIVVRGAGEVRIMPDRATIQFAIESRGEEPGTAAADAAARQQRTVEALRAAGVAEDDIATMSYSVMPEWEYDKHRNRVLKGYLAFNALRIETEELDRVGEWIDIALDAGVNHVNAVDFHPSDVDDARRQALAAAVEQARLDAETIADAVGGRLGRLVNITLEGPVRPLGATLERAQFADSPAAATQLTPGEQLVTAGILARWRFEED